MKLHALINLYNDRTFLAACLESISTVTDEIIVADGAYELYYQRYKQFVPEAQPFSTDGSIEILKGFEGLPTLHVLNPPEGKDHCWPNQTVKRTGLIDAVPNGDWFIIIDADEMLQGDVQESMEHLYQSGCVVGNCPIYTPGGDVDRLVPAWHPRFFQKFEGMSYKGTHWQLKDKYDRVIEDKYPVHWTDHMALVHFKTFKDQSRLIPHHLYMVDLMQRGWLEPKNLEEAFSAMYRLGGGIKQ